MTQPDDSRVTMTEPLPLWNAAVTHEASVVVPCRTADDVRGALERARAEGLPASVLGGGHDWAGRACRPGGLVIDVRPMRGVEVRDGVAEVGGGATAADLVAAAAPAGYAAATGAIGAVGVAGLTLGGGYGPLLGVAGLALDTLLGAEVVLADGNIVTTDAEHEPELFWALRGGGGNFGVVTSLRLRLQPYPTVLSGQVLFPFSQAAEVLAGYAELVADAPDPLTVPAGIVSSPDGAPVVYVAPIWVGDPGEGERWVRRIERLGAPITSMAAPVPYSGLLQRGDELFAADGRQYAIRTRSLAALTPGAISELVAAGAARTSALSLINMHHFHGAATRVGVRDTAFGIRREHFMVELIAAWREGDDVRHRAWADTAAGELRPHALPGGYPNLLGPDHHEQIAHAYGPNADRLLAVKASVDPENVFSAIPLPATSSAAAVGEA
jgi:FAD/FMN-containing dehydrogenase